MPRLFTPAFAAALMVPALCLAQASVSPLTLADADRLLLDANPAILQARHQLTGAHAGIDIAGARPNPQLTLGVSTIDTGGSRWRRPTDNSVRIDQTFERGDKRELRLKAAERGVQAADADLTNTIRLARIDLANAWIDLRTAQDVQRASDESAAFATRTAQAAELRGKAGDLAGVDVARYTADAARVANDAVQAGLQLAQARIALSQILGNRIAPNQLRAADTWPDEATNSVAANAERADIAAARRRLEQADALRGLARAQRSRDLSVGVQYEHTPASLNNAVSENTFGLSVSVPLFLGYDYRGDIARSEADYLMAEQELARIRAAVDGERLRLKAEVAAADARYRRLQDIALPAAERAARGAEVAIQKGGMSLTDYLDTQRGLRTARIETIQARADLARARQALALAGDTP